MMLRCAVGGSGRLLNCLAHSSGFRFSQGAPSMRAVHRWRIPSQKENGRTVDRLARLAIDNLRLQLFLL